MRVSKAVVERRMEDFLAACRRLGVKVTHQRLEIYRELASTVDHPDAQFIHDRLRRRMPTLSLDTVYRNLKLLEESGLISIVGMSHERLRFDANREPHHHFACTQCGKMRDFQSAKLSEMGCPVEAHEFGDAVSMHLEVRGICTECRGKRR